MFNWLKLFFKESFSYKESLSRIDFFIFVFLYPLLVIVPTVFLVMYLEKTQITPWIIAPLVSITFISWLIQFLLSVWKRAADINIHRGIILLCLLIPGSNGIMIMAFFFWKGHRSKSLISLFKYKKRSSKKNGKKIKNNQIGFTNRKMPSFTSAIGGRKNNKKIDIGMGIIEDKIDIGMGIIEDKIDIGMGEK